MDTDEDTAPRLQPSLRGRPGLMMFKGTLESLGYDVIFPRFTTRSWLGVAGEATASPAEGEGRMLVHLFNVPDIIYHNLWKAQGHLLSKAHLLITGPPGA